MQKLYEFAEGIRAAEGWIPPQPGSPLPDGSRSYRNHNPGNLRASIFQTDVSDGFARFANDTMGMAGLVYQLYLYASGKSNVVADNDTIEEAISKYADLAVGSPNLDNYLKVIEAHAPVNRTDLISSIL